VGEKITLEKLEIRGLLLFIAQYLERSFVKKAPFPVFAAAATMALL
jgi:hypothetical protein